MGSNPQRTDEHRRLAEELFPELPVRSFEPVGGGWDCFTYQVDGGWILQFPRLPGAVETTRKQISLLPRLAPELSAMVPVPELVSEEPLCMGYRRIPGEPLDVDAALGGDLPEQLGCFVRDLHAVPPEAVGWHPRGPEALRRDLRAELQTFRERVTPLLSPAERRAAGAMFEAFVDDDANFRFALAVVHRDIGPEHVLVTPEGDLAGVIDWGDAEVGDPALDLWWVAGHPEFGERMLTAYGGAPDARFRGRAEFYFRLGPWHEVTYGLDTDQPSFVQRGLQGVRGRLSA
jgi:aminoglycoside phosphotransferase (APT) family kinase protein